VYTLEHWNVKNKKGIFSSKKTDNNSTVGSA
jgi:hypothetical protein